MSDSPGQAAGDPAQLLVDARRRGDPDDVAEALVRHATALVQAGQIAQARQELDEAAAIHRQRGRAYDEARCTHLAATLCRLEGHPDEARRRAEHALRLVGPTTPIAVSAWTELGETALLEQKPAEAADAYTHALTAGEAAGLTDAARAALRRKRAIALTASGQYGAAVADLAAAHDLLVRAGDATGATRALIEQAAALQQGGERAEAARVRALAMRRARAAGDHLAQADLYLLESTQAVENGDVEAALAAARSARAEALAARAPIPYVSAAIALSQLAEATGDRVGAYEALAVGWVTLGDLLGREVARSTFEPKLLELRQRWGDATFAKVKAAYEARRRPG